MENVRIVVCGAAGKMGESIVRLAKLDKEIVVAGAVESRNSPALGTGAPAITADLGAVLPLSDVVIDFTSPSATLEHLPLCEKNGKAAVIGTTGFTPEEEKKIVRAAERIPVVFSANMSVGVNVLFRIARDVARSLPGYDVEIVEMHHNRKKDAPSGTAAHLARVIAGALGRDIGASGVYGRRGSVGARTKEEIGILSVRAGDTVGDHTVYFAGPGERIELTHRAHSRDTFAAGAIAAAKWVARRKPGLYSMQDVLGL